MTVLCGASTEPRAQRANLLIDQMDERSTNGKRPAMPPRRG
jgi:hypothetical protein